MKRLIIYSGQGNPSQPEPYLKLHDDKQRIVSLMISGNIRNLLPLWWEPL